MQLTSHAAVGAAVGVATGNPILAFVAGFISHHIIDAIPHTDGGSYEVSVENFARDKRIITIVGLDLALLILLSFLLFEGRGFNMPMIFGAFGAILPDLIDNVPFWSPRLRKIFPFNYYHLFHEKVHFTIINNKYFWVGILTQVILIAVSLWYVLK